MKVAARVRFQEKVKEYGGPASVAFALKCSRGTIDYICNGERNPGLETAFAIEQLFGIKMQEWCAPMKLETVRRLA